MKSVAELKIPRSQLRKELYISLAKCFQNVFSNCQSMGICDFEEGCLILPYPTIVLCNYLDLLLILESAGDELKKK